MPRWDTFTFRVSKDDRKLIENLAEKLQRSQSDAIRFVIRQAVYQTQETQTVNKNARNERNLKLR